LYNDAQIDHLIDTAVAACEEAGVDAVVAADPALLCGLTGEPRVPRIFVSTVGAVLNAEAARGYAELGAERVLLGRSLHVKEIAALRAAIPEVQVASYVLGDRCRFEESMCATTHCVPDSALFCSQFGQRSVSRRGKPLSGEQLRRWEAAWAQGDDVQLFLESSRASCATDPVLGQCGLCAVPDLVKAGVDSLKILGREASLETRLLRVRLVARLLKEWEGGRGLLAMRRLARELRGEPEVCDSGAACLYHDLPRR
jgi:putative protease